MRAIGWATLPSRTADVDGLVAALLSRALSSDVKPDNRGGVRGSTTAIEQILETSPDAGPGQDRTVRKTRAGRRIVVSTRVLALAAVSAFLAIAGYVRIFTWFASWDDEGYMLVSLD